MIFVIINWIYSIYTTIFLVYIVVWNISRMLHSTKNNRNQKYENLEVYIKYYYDKYVDIDTDVHTEEDLKLLCELIEKLKNQQKFQQKTK